MLTKFRTALLVVLLAAVVIPSAAWAIGEDEIGCERRLAETSAAFDQSFVDRDFDTFMAFIADDAIQINSVGQIFDGKEAIAGFTTAVMRNEYTFTHDLLHLRFLRCDSATVIQDTVFSIPSRDFTLHLEDTVVWNRLDGEWKVVLIQNTEIV